MYLYILGSCQLLTCCNNVLLLLLLLLLLFYYYSIWMSPVTGLFFPVLLLNQLWSPPLTLQASHCSTFRIMCDVPSTAVFCSESIECFPGTASKFFLKLLITTVMMIIIIIISFMYGIYTYIPETNYVLREYSVAAILLLLFMVLIPLFQCWIYCTFTLVLSAACVQCPIWLFSGVPWLHVF